jgi:hypothetical protein
MAVAVFSSLIGAEDVSNAIGRRPATARQAEKPSYQVSANYILMSSVYWCNCGYTYKIKNNFAKRI